MVQRGDGLLRLPAEAFEPGGVLADRANAFLATHPLAEEPLRRVLTLKLATVREDGEPTRRRALRSEFSDDEWRLVSELADHPNRLLVTATPEGGETYAEVAHEAIFRRWTKLQKWIESEREFLTWRSGLERDRRQWQAAPEDSKNDALLWGLALAEGQNWLALRAEDLPKVDREFIELSRKRDERERHEKARLRRRGLWFGAAALVLVLILGGDKLWQQRAELDQRAAFVSRNFAVAISTAQKLLDRTSTALSRGDISVKGARDSLREVQEIVGQAQEGERTLRTTNLLVRLLLTASDIFASLGDYSQAYDNAKKAKDMAEPFQVSDPNNPEVLHLLYDSIWRMGDAISDRGAAPAIQQQALVEYLEAQKLARRLLEMSPEDETRRRDLMFVHQKIGDARMELGDLDAAMAEYRAALTLIQSAVDGAPANRRWRRDLATTLRRIGQVHTAKNDFDGALEQLKVASEIITDLVKEDPGDNVARSNWASTHRDIAAVYAQRGDLDAALAAYYQAIAIQEQLIAGDRDNINWQVAVASFYTGAGNILRRQRDLPGALALYRRAYERRYQLALPSNPSRLTALALAGISVADLLYAQRQSLEEVVKLCHAAIEILDEARPRYDRNVFDCYLKIGDILVLQDDREGALKEYKLAWAIARDLVARNMDSVIWQRSLATSYIKIGDVLTAQERSREAVEQYQKALEIVTALAAKYPKSTEWPPLVESLKAKIQSLASKP